MTPETKILKVDCYSDIKCQKLLQQEEYIYNQDIFANIILYERIINYLFPF